MAIQIRRGTNTEWENNNPNIVVGEPAIVTDAERFFVGTASGDYAIHQGKLYKCQEQTTGTFDVSKWEQTSFVGLIKEIRETL